MDVLPPNSRFPSLDQLDSYGLTPFLLAVINGHTDIVRELLQFRLPVQPLPTRQNWNDLTSTNAMDSAYWDSGTCHSDPSSPSITGVEAHANPRFNLTGGHGESAAQACSPIDLHRKVIACWHYGRLGTEHNQSTSQLVVNPSTHDTRGLLHLVCGQFSALHLAVISGNVDLVALLLGHLGQQLNALAGNCVHLVSDDNVSVLDSPSPGHPAIMGTVANPLGLSSCLADLDEEVAYRMTYTLLDGGAVDEAQCVFHHAFERGHYRQAGLLLTARTLANASSFQSGLHLNLSHKCLGPTILPNWLWFLLNGPITEWLTQACVSYQLSCTPPGLFTSLAVVCRVSLSHCGLHVLPLNLLFDLPNLQELDLSWNHIAELPVRLPNPRPCCMEWAPQLIYLDLSHNDLTTIPSWLFTSTACARHNPATSFTQRVASADSVEAPTGASWNWGCSTFAPKLTHLMLSNNQLLSVPAQLWSSQSLNFVDLSWNVITHLPLPDFMFNRAPHGCSLSSFDEPLTNSELNANRFSPSLTDLTNTSGQLPTVSDGNLVQLVLKLVAATGKLSPFYGFNSLFGQRVDELLTYNTTQPLTNSELNANRFSPSLTDLTNTSGQLPTVSDGNLVQLVLNQPAATEADPTIRCPPIGSTLVHLWIQHNCLSSLIPSAVGGSAGTSPTARKIHSRTTAQSSSNSSFRAGWNKLFNLAPHLKHLDASYNRIKHFPGYEFFPSSLVHLDLSHNLLTNLEQTFERPRAACSRSVSYSRYLRRVSRTEFKRSTSYTGHSNDDQMRLDPKPSGGFRVTDRGVLPQLEHLNLRGNLLEHFSPAVPNCGCNTVAAKTSNISSGLEATSTVTAEHVPFTHGTQLIRFPALKTLDLGDNRLLTEISITVCDLRNLRHLFLDGCVGLIRMPADIWRLSNLHALYLDRTPFDPNGLLSSTNNKQARTETQQLQHTVTAKSSDDGPKHVQALLDQFKSAALHSRPYTSVRLLVLGPKAVGKSTLIRLLHRLDKGFEKYAISKTRNSTNSVNQASAHSQASRAHRPITGEYRRHVAGKCTTLSFGRHVADLSPVVLVSRLTIQRPFDTFKNEAGQSPLDNDGRPMDEFQWCSPITFNVWDIGTGLSAVSSVGDLSTPAHSANTPQSNHSGISSDTLAGIQQLLFCRNTVFLVLWCMSDGVAGLNEITRWLMIIQARAPMCPIILVGTHADRCVAFDGKRVPLRRSRVDVSFQNSLEHLNSLVRSRFTCTADLAAYGLPNLFSHVMLDLRPDENPRLWIELERLATLLHKAANSIQFPKKVCADSDASLHLVTRCPSGFHSAHEAQAALLFLNAFGLLLHFTDPTLKHLVFLSPAWLVQLLLRLFTALHAKRPASTAVIRHNHISVGQDSSDQHLKCTHATSTPTRNTAILTETELQSFIHYSLGADSAGNDLSSDMLASTDLGLVSRALISLLIRLELVVRLDNNYLLFPCLLSTRSVHNQCVVRCDTSKGLNEMKSSASTNVGNVVTQLVFSQPTPTTLLNGPREQESKPLNIATEASSRSSITAGWTVHTLVNEEIVRLYAMTHIPSGFWTRLASRLLTDSTFHDICSQIYPLSCLPAPLSDDVSEQQEQQQLSEWTVWNRGMRLSLANGRIGLARLQQFTRSSCALHRDHWLRKPISSSHSSNLKSRSFGDHLHSSDEWEEVAAIEGEEVHTDLGSEDSPVRVHATHFDNANAYRSGVVGAARNTYAGREVRLLRWSPDSSPNITPSVKPTAEPSKSLVADFSVRSVPGRLVCENYGGLQSSCLIEIYLPNHRLLWNAASVRQSSTCTNSMPERSAPKTEPICVIPNQQAVAKLLTKIVDHMDRLLEDWYPDLGSRFRQSNDGLYTVNRIIPCCVCLSAVSPSSVGRNLQNHQSNGWQQMMEPSGALSRRHSIGHVQLLSADTAPTDALPSKQNGHSISSDHLNHIDPNDLIIGLSATNHHLSVQPPALHQGDLTVRKRTSHHTQSADPVSHFSSFITATSEVYAVRVSEYLHWLIMGSEPSLNSAQSHSAHRVIRSLCCPVHKSVPFRAPDLHFQDYSPRLLVPSQSVQLLNFLGRGSFASVFAGSWVNRGSRSEDLSNTSATVAVKLSSPIHPQLIHPVQMTSHSLPSHTNVSDQTDSDMRDALALYRQEERRWTQYPVEACVTAYLELRAELNVLEQIGHGLNTRRLYSPKIRRPKSQLLMHPTTRLTAVNRVHKRSLQALHRIASVCEGGLLDAADTSRPSHLLVCLGLIAPNPLGLLIPFVPHGNLTQYLKALSPLATEVTSNPMDSEVSHPLHPLTMQLIVHQLSLALTHLHRLFIVHRDVKLDNLLVWELPPNTTQLKEKTDVDPRAVHIVLTDYGVSQRRSPSDGCRGYVGTVGYMAPEILDHLGEETYTEKVDIYSLGIIICELIKCGPAYKHCGSMRFHLTQQVLSGKRPDIPTQLALCSPLYLLELMSTCWATDPYGRPSATQISQLTSPWWHPCGSKQSCRISNTSGHCSKDCRITPVEMNGLSHTRSVHRFDSPDVVTCAVADPNANLWVGGYRRSVIPPNAHNGHAACNAPSFCTETDTIYDDEDKEEGLLIWLPASAYVDLSSDRLQPRLVDHWPLADMEWPIGWSKLDKVHAMKLPQSDSIKRDWPQRLCYTQFSTCDQFLINCLTAQGVLTVYSRSHLQRLLRVRLPFALSDTRVSSSSCRATCYLMFTVDCWSKVTQPEHNTTGNYLLVVARTSGPVLLVHLMTETKQDCSQMTQRVRVASMRRVDASLDVHCGISLSSLGRAQLWLGQSHAELSCYEWVRSQCTTASSHYTSPLPEHDLRPVCSWPVSSARIPFSSSVVSGLLAESVESANTYGTREQDLRVWSYLYPEHELTCWSAMSRTRLRSISITDFIPSVPAGRYGKHTTLSNNVCHMEWLTSSTLLLLNCRGQLICLDIPDSNKRPLRIQIFYHHCDLHSSDECSVIIVPRRIPTKSTPVLFTLHRGLRDLVATAVPGWRRNRLSVATQRFYLVSLFCDKFLFP
ncbi:hypothetical protein P879_02025 [Paragonimus westermani]|uniref:Protein kinase domain-containing protein n=1 Tax=Paragonimus westermani TaxID=34504 RepID=A0A8T0DUP8_9TREM|nr:hypothetical protein P879_02025 [Paragonimus westermani]